MKLVLLAALLTQGSSMGVVDAGVRRVASAARMPPTEEGGARRLVSHSRLFAGDARFFAGDESAFGRAARALCALDGVYALRT